MARQGRELELIIEKIESSSLPEGALIKSPGFIEDKITGQQREVDVLVEYELGTVQIMVIIECRDRKSSQDTQWIEQIATKVNDLNANKVIAVSSSKFTGPALKKAIHYGIETRLLEEVNANVIGDWWKVEHLQVARTSYLIKSSQIICEKPKMVVDKLKGKKVNDKFINRTIDDEVSSLNDILAGNINKIEPLNSLVPNGPSLTIQLNLNFSNSDDCYLLKSSNRESKISQINMAVEFKLIHEQKPISRVKNYRDENKVISEVIEFDDISVGENDVLQFIRNTDGSLSLSARKK